MLLGWIGCEPIAESGATIRPALPSILFLKKSLRDCPLTGLFIIIVELIVSIIDRCYGFLKTLGIPVIGHNVLNGDKHPAEAHL
jgi:hypothetical protein